MFKTVKGPSMKKNGLFVVLALSGLIFASCASCPSKNAFGPYSEAETFYGKGNYSKAIEKYGEYLSKNPQGSLAAVAQYYIAKSYIASKDSAKARASFEQVVKQYPQTSWAEFAKEQLKSWDEKAQS